MWRGWKRKNAAERETSQSAQWDLLVPVPAPGETGPTFGYRISQARIQVPPDDCIRWTQLDSLPRSNCRVPGHLFPQCLPLRLPAFCWGEGDLNSHDTRNQKESTKRRRGCDAGDAECCRFLEPDFSPRRNHRRAGTRVSGAPPTESHTAPPRMGPEDSRGSITNRHDRRRDFRRGHDRL